MMLALVSGRCHLSTSRNILKNNLRHAIHRRRLFGKRILTLSAVSGWNQYHVIPDAFFSLVCCAVRLKFATKQALFGSKSIALIEVQYSE